MSQKDFKRCYLHHFSLQILCVLTQLVCSYSEEFIFKKGVNNKSVWDLVASGDLDEAGRAAWSRFIYIYFGFLHFITNPRHPERNSSTVKLQKCFVDNETSADFHQQTGEDTTTESSFLGHLFL